MQRVLLMSVLLVAFALLLVVVPAKAAPTPAEIDLAIQKGLAWLAANQRTDGSWGTGSYALGQTAAAVLAMEDEGHFPGSGTAYAANVEIGLDYILSKAYIQSSLPEQNAGDPDSDGDGRGVYFYHYQYMYETGMCLMALVASNAPNRVVTTGSCAGWTYLEVAEDTVDFLAYAQNEAGNGRGGWRYTANSGDSDNSVAQWPVLGMIAAELWGVQASGWVKDELEFWVNYIQSSDGGSGYTSPGSNVARTGALLVEHYWLGDDRRTSTRAQRAINYINAHWGGSDNKGSEYAMFAVYKGLALMRVSELPNAADGDWWGDYCQYLVDTQIDVGTDQGYWNSSYGTLLATGWYIVILQATIFPVEVYVDLPPCACDNDGYDVDITYSIQRFQVDGSLEIYKDDVLVETIVLDDFQGSEVHTISVESETLGEHTWAAFLEVTTAEDISAESSDEAAINICETPVVSDIPDQLIPDRRLPYTAFDLDDYLVSSGSSSVVWSASAPTGWGVNIDADNVVTVTAPESATEPATITFTAGVACCTGVVCSDSDEAVFTPNIPPVAVAQLMTGYCGLVVGKEVQFNGANSYDPDGDPLTYRWSFDDGCTSTEMNPGHEFAYDRTYNVTLIVNDGKVDSLPSSVSVTIRQRPRVISVYYDVPDTTLIINFNGPVMPDPICFDDIGMEVDDSGEWDFALSKSRPGLKANETEPCDTITMDINRAHPTTVNMALAALVTRQKVDFLLREGAFVDECGNEVLPVVGTDDITIQMMSDGYILGVLGDADGNGKVTAFDAVIILKATVNDPAEVIPIYDAAASVTEWLLSQGEEYDILLSNVDVSDSGDITAYDAALALMLAVDLPLPAPSSNTGIKKARVKLGSYHDQNLEVTIDLDNVSDVRSADIVLTYDPEELTVVDVSRTSAISGWLSEQRADSGRLRISLAGAYQPSSSGSLVNVKFHAVSEDSIGKLDLTDLKLNGGMLKAYIENLPKVFALMQNYPNPFNPETWVPYQLSETSDVTITIYSVNGQLVRRLELGTRMPGYYTDKAKSAYWDGRNESGERVSSGIYFYQLQAGQDVAVKKMIMVK